MKTIGKLEPLPTARDDLLQHLPPLKLPKKMKNGEISHTKYYKVKGILMQFNMVAFQSSIYALDKHTSSKVKK